MVCRSCERWNLSPLDERWEAIDQAEKLYSKREMKNTWWKKDDLLRHVESQKTFRWPKE